MDDLISACEKAVHTEQIRLLEQQERARETAREPAGVLTVHAHDLRAHELEAPWM